MSSYSGKRRRILFTGASGILGLNFISRYSEKFEIFAISNRSDIPAKFGGYKIFDPIENRHYSPDIHHYKCDLSSEDDMSRALDLVERTMLGLDYIINAAADTRFLGDLKDATFFSEQLSGQLYLNSVVPVTLTSAVFHRFWKNGQPKASDRGVINISSVSSTSIYAGYGQGAYAASKAALNMATMHMARDYEAYGIRVNALSPTSFPSLVPTDKVANAIAAIIDSTHNGTIFQVGGDGARVAEA